MSVVPFGSNIAARTLHLLDHTTLWHGVQSRTAHLQHSITHETIESLAANISKKKGVRKTYNPYFLLRLQLQGAFGSVVVVSILDKITSTESVHQHHGAVARPR